MRLARLVALAVLTGALGCATVPTEQLVDAKVSIRAARDGGAAKDPAAARHLALAEQEQSEAQKAMEAGHREEAKQLLWRAQADAELALALAEQAPAQRDAAAAQRRLQQSRPQQTP